jgi:hypothetical protein
MEAIHRRVVRFVSVPVAVRSSSLSLMGDADQHLPAEGITESVPSLSAAVPSLAT